MPLLKNAKKKLRQDKERTIKNKKQKQQYRDLVKAARVEPSDDTLSKAFQAVDKAAKKNLIHDNKAARLKSSLSKVLDNKKNPKADATTPVVKTAKKTKGKKTTKKATTKSKKK